MGKCPDVIDEHHDLLVIESGRDIDHFISADIIFLRNAKTGVKILQLPADVAAIQRNQLRTVKDHLALPVVTVAFHAVIGKNVSSLFDVLFALRHFRENDWHFRHRLCRFFDLLFRQGHRNRPHLLSGGVILMRPTLSFSKFPELLLDIPTGKPGDGWTLEFLVPFPVLSVAGDANLLSGPLGRIDRIGSDCYSSSCFFRCPLFARFPTIAGGLFFSTSHYHQRDR